MAQNIDFSGSDAGMMGDLTSTDITKYATLGSVKIEADVAFAEQEDDIETTVTGCQSVSSTTCMQTKASEITNDGTNYYMEFEVTLGIIYCGASCMNYASQVVTYTADLGLMSQVTPPISTELPTLTINAEADSFTETEITSTITVDAFNVSVGKLKSVRVALDKTTEANPAIQDPLF